MKIKFYGARGSIPVSGDNTRRYGGNTTCFNIEADDGTNIIIDAGSGIRELGERYIKKKINEINIIFTHYHLDHLIGLPFFRPMFSPSKNINIYGPRFENLSCESVLNKIISPPAFPLMIADMKLCHSLKINDITEQNIKIGPFDISSIKLNHPNGGLGYKISEGGKEIVVLTDNELDYIHPDGKSFEDYLKFVKGCDLLLHDSEFSPNEYNLTAMWGHSTYTSATKLAVEADVKVFGLIHHNQFRSDDEMDNIVSECKKIISDSGKNIECIGIKQNSEMVI